MQKFTCGYNYLRTSIFSVYPLSTVGCDHHKTPAFLLFSPSVPSVDISSPLEVVQCVKLLTVSPDDDTDDVDDPVTGSMAPVPAGGGDADTCNQCNVHVC